MLLFALSWESIVAGIVSAGGIIWGIIEFLFWADILPGPTKKD